MARRLGFASVLAVLVVWGLVWAGGPALAAPANLQVTKSVSPDLMIIGAESIYTVTVTNTGDEAAEDVTVTDTLDSNVTAGDLPPECTASGQIVTCGGAGVTVAPGDSVSYEIPVTVDPGVSDGTNITNTATATTSTPGAITGQAQLISQTQTQTDVEITKTGPAEANDDGTITYTIDVTNHGPSEAVGVTVHDPTDGQLTTIVDQSAQCPGGGLTVTCPLGTLQPGETVSLTLTVRVNEGVEAGTTIPNCATVYTGSRETETDNNQSCVSTVVPGPGPVEAADVSIRKTGTPTVQPDGSITYTLEVTNNGPGVATDVVIRDVEDELVDGADLPPDCTESGDVVTCSVGDLQAGETRVLTFTEHVSADAQPGSTVHNCAIVTTSTRERAVRDNASCMDTQVEDDDPSPTPTDTDLPPSPTPTDTDVAPTPTPTDTDVAPTPTDTPTGDGTPTPTETPTPNPAPGPSAGPGSGDGEETGASGPGSGLPFTGLAATGLALVAAALIAAGLLARTLARRRR